MNPDFFFTYYNMSGNNFTEPLHNSHRYRSNGFYRYLRFLLSVVGSFERNSACRSQTYDNSTIGYFNVSIENRLCPMCKYDGIDIFLIFFI